MTSRRVPAIALALLLCATGSVAYWNAARATAAMDFYQIWAGARMARETGDFYDAGTGARMGERYFREAVQQGSSARHIEVARYRRNLEMFSTPFLYTSYAPLRGAYERDLLIFQSVAFVCFLAWVFLFTRLFDWDIASSLMLLAVLLIAFEPLRADVRVGSVNHPILLLLSAGAILTAGRRFLPAGAMLAIAAVVKPYVIFIFPVTYLFWMARRRWGHIAAHAMGATAAGAAAMIGSSLYFRSAGIWLEWIEGLRAMPQAIVPLEVGNIALVVVIRETTGLHASSLLWIAASLALFVAAWRWKPDARFDVPLILLACVFFQLGSPLVWMHYLLLAVPLIIWLLRPSRRPGVAARQIAGASALALIAVEPWARYVPTMTHVGSLVNVGLLIAFGTAVWSLRTSHDQDDRDAAPSSFFGEDGVKPDEHGDRAEHDHRPDDGGGNR